MSDIHVVVLAAGKGTRMKSLVPKVLHRTGGIPLIEHVLRTSDALRPKSVVVVVGHQAGDVERAIQGRPGLTFAVQEPQLGTGHAVLQAEPFLAGATGTVILLSGDVPLLRARTLEELRRRHDEAGAAATVVTAVVDAPDGYGRIVRSNGHIAAIVEHKDASPAERQIREINSGIYAFDLPPLFDALRAIGSSNAQGEYYLPDLVRIYRERGLPVETVTVADSREILGVNSRKELADIGAVLRMAKNDELMAAGVTIVDPSTTYIDPDVEVGPDTILHPGIHLEGQTRIGARCVIRPGVRIVDSAIDDDATINSHSVITSSHVASGADVGPFAHLRPASDVGVKAHVGAFVELKKTSLGRGTKAGHLAYLGDATIGENVNIGAGVITVNYDGTKKHATVIENDAFVGSDAQLIAPVRVGQGAYVAAGSSITENVPAESLAIARGRQTNKEGWVRQRKARVGK